jgi:peptidoglycan/xylan/chitin deacetylase (PgdA/CDA1 family)
MMSRGADIRATRAKLSSIARTGIRSVRSRLPRRPRPAILMYHRIADDRFDPWGTIVSPGMFALQIGWLREKRTVLPLTDFADLHRSGNLPPDAIAITFDDGYACNAVIAAPLLEQLGLSATIFLPVEWIEKGKTYWWDEIRDIVFENDAPSLRLGERLIALGPTHVDDLKWTYGKSPRTPRQAAFREVTADLIRKTPKEIEASMKELRRQRAATGNTTVAPSPMTRDQIRRMEGSAIDFGSHALNHPALTSLDAAGQAHEICDSLTRCEALTGSPPATFAYPYGLFDEQSQRLVEETGFSCACAALPGRIGPDTSVFALPRLQVGNWTAGRLKRSLALV